MHNFYRFESCIWDIGCDHGLLGLSFTEIDSVKEIHLVDPSALVMKTLSAKLKDSYITKKDFIFCHEIKGQEIKLTTFSNLIFIAGMGGKEIREILIHLISQLKPQDRVVISPHRKILELREFLANSKLHLEEEMCLIENGQFYEVMVLGPTASKKVHPFGESIWKGAVGEKYRNHLIEAFTPHQDPLGQGLVSYLKALSP